MHLNPRSWNEYRQQSFPSGNANLILSVILLRVSQDTVAKSQDVLVGGISLVSQIFKPQHGALTRLVFEWRLQDAKDLEILEKKTY